MKSKKDITEDITRLHVLSQVVQAYEEIAATRMQKIRQSVLKNRAFLDGVSVVFSTVKLSYKKEVERLTKEKKGKDVSLQFSKTNGKTVCVLLSANTGLYGAIMQQTFDLFLQTSQRIHADAVIIGKLGVSFLKTASPNLPYTTFDLPDGLIQPQQLHEIILYLLAYEKIIVFHGTFESIITQVPTTSALSGDISEKMTATKQQTKYLFEPSLPEVMATFEKEIFASLFEHSVHESQLSKFASRMVLLDTALQNIQKELSTAVFEEKKLKHTSQNSKQQTMLSGKSLWR